jgi:hypothetical protein
MGSASSPSAHKEIDHEYDKQQTSNAAAHRWAAVIVSTAAPKQKQQDDDEQNKIHGTDTSLSPQAFLTIRDFAALIERRICSGSFLLVGCRHNVGPANKRGALKRLQCVNKFDALKDVGPERWKAQEPVLTSLPVAVHQRFCSEHSVQARGNVF